MKKSTTCEINGKTYTVSELTVGEIDAVIGAINAEGPLHRTYNIMDYDLTPEFVAASAGIEAEAHAALTPDELDALVAAVSEVNARFLARVLAKQRKMRGAGQAPATPEALPMIPEKPSTATPAC